MSGQSPGPTSGAPTAVELRVPSHGNGRLMPAWKKGQPSINPGGMSPSSMYHQARKICAEMTPEAIAKQAELMRTCDDPRVVTIVTQAIIDRGAGKIRDHSGEQEGGKFDLTTLSLEERKAMADLLIKAFGL